METLAYLHLALTYEEALDSNECSSETSVSLKLKGRTLKKRGRYCLLALGAALGFLGTTTQAFALLKPGVENPTVTRVQKRLQELNYFDEEPTGYYGPITSTAVKEFQRDRGLDPDGMVGEETEAALFGQKATPFNEENFLSGTSELTPIESNSDSFIDENSTRTPISKPESLQETPTTISSQLLRLGARGQSVQTLQEKLRDEGFSPGIIDGVYGQQTQNAVMEFQRANGLDADGIVGKQTLSVLNLIASEPSPSLYERAVRNS
ncbi:peptidoglycan-binding protein [Lusitaniella coriacea LEGE 07157]|uniref:Peptidoglycan-binding protein n=1 Tax=Lusitaniella coriacea LEGE 07157 TaxID=945747 RepID=A0A8J7B741_9CYAN|nr:peptidoglycan-binding protein [Lusitaniella coriacea]MBE9115084.1 peptidoglycan-binding protein [Lusitaniella coriacea LEGE 07157]